MLDVKTALTDSLWWGSFIANAPFLTLCASTWEDIMSTTRVAFVKNGLGSPHGQYQPLVTMYILNGIDLVKGVEYDREDLT